MNDSHILTECYIDTLLANVLSPPTKRHNHQKSCNNVLKTMREKFADQAAFGIIDDDKVVLKSLEKFSLQKKQNEHLSIYKHKDSSHYIVKIGKAAEDFILRNAQRCGVELSTYDLPADLEGLKRITKHINSLNDAEIKFKKLFAALKQNPTSDFYTLAQWIESFKKSPYDITII
jgi:hypothetical protein